MQATISIRAVSALFLVGAGILFSGCQTQQLRLTPEQEKVRGQLAAIHPWQDPLAAKTRIVDIHTHTFNSRYLPLRNILLGKRDAAAPVSWLLSDSCAKTVAQVVNDRTTLAPAAGEPGITQTMENRLQYDHGVICGILLKLLEKAANSGAWNPKLPHMTQMKRLDAVADKMNLQERMAVRATGHMMGMDESLKAPDQNAALRSIVRFIWMLTQNDAEMPKLFRTEYAGAPMLGNPLMISHMMDLGPVYGQAADRKDLLDFASQQVRRNEDFQKRPNAGMVYFVAYNPYRDRTINQTPDDALRLMRDAVEKHGAWGVKVYPPSGYRPSDNKILPKARALNKWPGEEWEARYGKLGPNADVELNRRLEELLVWCIKADVPVFVHSGTGEFEARKGYGLYHSNPHFWRIFLESHPEPDGSPCRLRLCLGHAGGENFWFGSGKYGSWGQEAADLCREFPNVYCEITTHNQMLDPIRQAFFADRLITLFAESAQPASGKARYPFAKKLLYGTDWYLPDAGERRNILMATEQVFLHEKLRAHYGDYFGGNALNFLNARARLKDSRHPLPREVRARVQSFLRPTP